MQANVCKFEDKIWVDFFPFSAWMWLTCLDAIEKGSYQIKQENDEPIDNIEELVEELPDSQPRFALVSYPYKLSDGRTKSPFVLVYWRPLTCGNESKMLYAGAVEFFRGRAGVSKYVNRWFR